LRRYRVFVGRFTLQCATEKVSQDLWSSPDFILTNYLITAVWALTFTVMVIPEAAILYAPGLPTKVGVIITVAALYGPFRFTADYPKRRDAAKVRILRFKNLPPFRHDRGLQNHV